jgi:hypothetical protein
VLAVWVAESAFLFPDTNLERVSFVFNRNGFNVVVYFYIYRMFGDTGRPATAAPGRAKAEAQPQAEA